MSWLIGIAVAAVVAFVLLLLLIRYMTKLPPQ
jgi:high-affinity Fe2+/Pb2+ permease